jgi:proteasome lid subunit RPN8/RPN11
MKNKVRVDKNALNYFRKVARESSPLEIQAYLIGHVVSPELTIINEIKYTREYADQTTEMVRWWMKDFKEIQKDAEERGLRVVGDIHSHPNWDSVLSPQDYKSMIESGFRLCGICSVMNGKTRVRFWIPESSLTCEIEYVKRSKDKYAVA